LTAGVFLRAMWAPPFLCSECVPLNRQGQKLYNDFASWQGKELVHMTKLLTLPVPQSVGMPMQWG